MQSAIELLGSSGMKDGQRSSTRWTGVQVAVLVIWLTCILALLPSPWHWARDAEVMAKRSYELQNERAAMQGAAAPAPLSAERIEKARRAAWSEWFWLAALIAAGILISIFGPKDKRRWSLAIAAVVALYVASRWYFAPSSYTQLIAALFDEGARSGQMFLARNAPMAFAQLTYFNVIAPMALIVLTVVRLLKSNHDVRSSTAS